MFARIWGSTERATSVGLLALRVGAGLMFALAHGLPKVSDLPGFVEKVGKLMPWPALFGPAAALSELVGGVLVALGLFTRPAAFFALVTMLVAALHVHAADPFARKELALVYAVVFLTLLVSGSGRYGVDAWLARRRR